MSEPRRVQVIVTRRFERALDELLDFYDSLRLIHPDAGTRAVELIETVEGALPKLLAEQPDIGRSAQLSLSQSEDERSWLERLLPLISRRGLRAREWRVAGFWVLYYRGPGAVYLASARHERESGYR